MPTKYLRRSVLSLVILIMFAFIIYVAMCLKSLAGLSDAYASDWTAIFIIEHLKASENNWPANWADLQDEFDRMAEPSHYAWSFAELQERVNLRFDLTADQVHDADPPIEAIRLTSGRQISFDGNPNVNVREYLRTGKGGMESLRRKNSPAERSHALELR